MATDFSVAGLAAWTAADPTKTLQTALLYENEGGTWDTFDYHTGVKYKTKVPNFSAVTTDISTGAIEGYNTPSGSVTMKDVELETTPLKVFESYTKAVLAQKITTPLEKRGTDPEELPFGDVLMDLKGKDLFYDNEQLIWQAEKDASIQDAGKVIGQIDGILAQVSALGTGTEARVSVCAGVADNAEAFYGLADSSIRNLVRSLVLKRNEVLPKLIKKDMIMAMSPANFDGYATALFGLSGQITKDTIGADGEITQTIKIPGSKITVRGMIGLDGKNEILLTVPENIIVAYDLKGEDEQLELWYNKAAKRHELFGAYKLGVKVVDPSLCVISLPATVSTL